MKCLIFCRDFNTEWVLDYVQKNSPYILKMVGKPILEFYIDLASIAGIKDVRIVTETPDVAIEEYFANGDKWGLNISYSIAREGDSLEQIIKKNNSFVGESPLFLISGYVFIDYDKNNQEIPFLKSENPQMLKTENGALYYLSKKRKLDGC